MMRLNIATDDYGKFIEQLRERARNPKRYTHNRPVLPDMPSDPLKAEYFDIQLRADRVLIVKMRRFDLYLFGFQMESGKWFEFKRPNKIHQIEGSEHLPFDENYSHLGGLKSLCETGLGYKELKAAVDNLEDVLNKKQKTKEDVENQKLYVMTLAVMLCESTRFVTLSNPFAVAMKLKNQPAQFKSWMPDLINSWSDLSERLLKTDQKPDGEKYYFRLPKKACNVMKNDTEKITSASDAAECLGILKSTSIRDLVPKPLPLYPGSVAAFGAAAANSNNNNIRGEGQPMVEVFSVYINHQIPAGGNLYGTIQVTDGLGSMCLYNRARNDPEPIRSPNDTASLTGPARAISLCQIFTLSLDLKDSKDNLEVSKGEFSWGVFLLCTMDEYYDKRFSQTVKGKYGSATVYYAMFHTAVQAYVSIVLVSGDHGKDPVTVYGSIAARYSNYGYATADEKQYYQAMLFNKPSNKLISVRPGNPIPLSRSTVAVPTSPTPSNLIVEAGLSDDKFAKGAALFSSQINGSSVKDIKGKNGSIRVTVTWSQVSQ